MSSGKKKRFKAGAGAANAANKRKVPGETGAGGGEWMGAGGGGVPEGTDWIVAASTRRNDDITKEGAESGRVEVGWRGAAVAVEIEKALPADLLLTNSV
jgi:hypothetical protein